MASQTIRGFPEEDRAAITFRLANGALGTFMLSDTAASNRNWEHASVEDQARFALAHADDADCNLVCGTRARSRSRPCGCNAMGATRIGPGPRRCSGRRSGSRRRSCIFAR